MIPRRPRLVRGRRWAINAPGFSFSQSQSGTLPPTSKGGFHDEISCSDSQNQPPRDSAQRLPRADEPGRLQASNRSRCRHGAEDQHLLALLLSGELYHALAARRRHARDEEGRVRSHPDPRLPQPHRRDRRAPGRAGEQAAAGGRGTWPAQRPPVRRRRVDPRPRSGGRSDRRVPLPQRRLPEGIPHSPTIHRREHHPSADGQDPRLHDDHRCDEERLRGAAQRASTLDPSGDPRDPRRSPDDPEEDPPRGLRGDGRHLRRRRSRPAVHDSPRQERDPRPARTRSRSTRWPRS